MYPYNGSNERYFSTQSIAAFDNTNNNACLSVVGDPVTQAPPTTTTPPSGDCIVDIVINSDNYPEETSWKFFVDSTGEVLAEQGFNVVTTDLTVIHKQVGVDANVAHTFTIEDSYGDGICCDYGSGSFTVSVAGQTILSGGEFGSSYSGTFTLDAECLVQVPTTGTPPTTSKFETALVTANGIV